MFVNGRSDDAPYRGPGWHFVARRNAERFPAPIPPNDNVGFVGIQRPINNGDVTVENARRFPLVAAHSEKIRAGAVRDQESVQVQAAQTRVGRRVWKPGVYRNAVWAAGSSLARGAVVRILLHGAYIVRFFAAEG